MSQPNRYNNYSDVRVDANGEMLDNRMVYGKGNLNKEFLSYDKGGVVAHANPLSQVENLVATATATSGEVDVDWDDVTNADTYYVEYWATGTPDTVFSTEVSISEATLTGLTNNTVYAVKAQARAEEFSQGVIFGAWSAEDTVTPTGA